MKRTFFISILCVIFSVSLYAQQDNANYYYHQGEKIFLQQSTDKIFLKFAQNTNKEQVRSLINNKKIANIYYFDNQYIDVLSGK